MRREWKQIIVRTGQSLELECQCRFNFPHLLECTPWGGQVARRNDRSEGLGVLGIAVVQQIAAIPQRTASLHGHISRDLPPSIARTGER
jgi:hypothetical protein